MSELEVVTEGAVRWIALNRPASNQGFSTVCANNEAGGTLAARHLLDLGHRKIAHLTGPKQHGNLSDRTRGFVRTLQAAKNAIHPIVRYGKFNFAGGADLTRKLLDAHPDVTAIFAANNFIAVGTMLALREAGIRVPEDMSAVAFDDLPPAITFDPFFTVAAQSAYQMGERATDLLLARLEGGGPPVNPVPVDIAAALRRIAAEAQPFAPSLDLRIELDIGAGNGTWW